MRLLLLLACLAWRAAAAGGVAWRLLLLLACSAWLAAAVAAPSRLLLLLLNNSACLLLVTGACSVLCSPPAPVYALCFWRELVLLPSSSSVFIVAVLTGVIVWQQPRRLLLPQLRKV